MIFALWQERNSVHAQGQLWGVASEGGTDGLGVIYRTNLDGTGLTVAKSFLSPYSGVDPIEGFVEAPNGKLYGVTNRGGMYDYGVLFELNPATGEYVKKVDFNYTVQGAYPNGGLLLHSNGKLYGVTRSTSPNGWGGIYEYDPNTGAIVEKMKFSNFNVGSSPYGRLAEGAGGKLYGVTFTGMLYEYDMNANSCVALAAFGGTNGSSPFGGPVVASNGKLYGATSTGGANNLGVIYSYDLVNGVYTKIDLSTAIGATPKSSLVEASGKLYGVTSKGGSSDKGVVFEIDPVTFTYTKKADFTTANGGGPECTLLKASNGKLYGMTPNGGANSIGVIFEYDAQLGTMVKKFDFTTATGGGTYGTLVQASNGKLYGPTRGTIIDYDYNTGVVNNIGGFNASPNGKYPVGRLTKAGNGKFYGLAQGGTNGYGILYEFDPVANTLIKKQEFNATTGGDPRSSLFLASNGKLYGVTAGGSLPGANYGTLFEYDADANTLLVKFTFNQTSGATPQGELTELNGKLFGVARTYGANGQFTGGTLFDYNISSGVFTKRFDFSAATGILPTGKLTLASNGKMYGICGSGGINGYGTLFEFDPSTGVVQKKYDYSFASGGISTGWLIEIDGLLYGTNSNGNLTEFNPVTGTMTTRIAHNYSSSSGGLLVSPNGKLYKGVQNGIAQFDLSTNSSSLVSNLAGPGESYGPYGKYPVGSLITVGQSINFPPIPDKTYGDVFTLNATATSGLPVTYSSSNPAIATINGNTVTVLAPGTAIITASQAGDQTFNAAPSVDQQLTADKAPLAVTPDTQTKIYGDANPPLTFTYSGFKLSENASVIDTPPTPSTTATVTSNVGSYPITMSGGLDNNYTFVPVNNTLSITQAPLTITADLKAKVYGDTNPQLTLSYSGFKGSDDATVLDTPPTVNTTATTTSNVGPYPIDVEGGSDNNYSLSLVDGTLTITQAVLTATADNKSKIYGDANPVLTVSYTGFKGTDNASVIDVPATTSTTAITTSNVGSYPVTPAGASDNNYSFAYVNGTLAITQAVLTATADNKSKVYGNANPALTISYTGFKGTDNSTVLDVLPTASTTATTTSNVGGFPITPAGGSDNNYSFAYVNGTLTITQAVITATADNKSKVYYDLNPALTISYSGFKGTDNVAVLDVLPTASTSATTSSNAGTYPITPSGGSDNNYSFSYVNGTLTISQAVLTATADNKTKIYGDANPPLTISYSGFKGSDNSSVLDVLPTASTGATATSSVGTYTITPSGGSDNNYSFSYVNGTLSITQAVLTATADNKTKVYGNANPALTISYSGFKGTDNSSVLDVLPTASTGATTTSNVGTYTITPSGGSDNNYSFSYVNGTLSITQAVLTATADNKTKVYGNANPALTISYSGFKGTDNSTVLDVLPTASTGATTTSSVGTYTITPSGGSDNNYSFTYVNGTLSITQAVLTATADNKTKVYGDANPALTISYSGFKGTDNSSVLDVLPTASTSATTTSSVGNYTITPSGGSDNNYTFSYVNGTLSITQAVLTATADNKTKVYGNANPALTVAYSGFKGTDNSSVLDVPPTASTGATTTSNAGTYTITPSGGSDNNYAFSYVNGTLSITQAVLTATADNKSKVYGDANPTLTISYSGFKGTDNSTVLDVPPTASTTATTSSSVGPYTITPAGGNDNNYSLSYVNGTLAIGKAPLTASADNKSKVYGQAVPALTISYSGFKGADDATVIDVLPAIATGATSSSNVDTYPITLSGGSDNNYSLTLVDGLLTVTKAVLTASADPKTKIYGDMNPPLTITYSGFVGSEDVTVIDVEPSSTTTATLTSNVGVYPINLSGGSDNNYSFSLVSSTLTIYKAEQSITFPDIEDKTYGDGQFILYAIGGPTGNPVTFASSDPGVISVFGNVGTVVGAGTCIITASQAGNQNYNAAPPETQSVTVNKASQTITLNAIPAKNFGDAAFDPGATSSSGLAVSYTSSDLAVATINNNMVTIVGAGTATITASQAGNANYSAAADQGQMLTVNASPFTVTPATSTICLGTSTILTASGAASYSWSPATGLSSATGASVTANPRTTTTYTVTATYANGTVSTATATVKVNSIPLAAGTSHSVIMYCGSCGGGVTASGLNSSGQLGDGTTTQKINPVALGLTGITSVAAGANHTLFLKDDGTVWATGLNTNGQLGIGSTTNRTSPIQISTLSGIIAISAGTSHSLFLKDDGTVWATGLNSSGQLGDATTAQKTTPVQVAVLTGIVKISAGGLHSLFLKNDGTVWACGRNTNGQLGINNTTNQLSPVMISSLTGIVDISGGGTHSHFVKNNGNVYGTGLNSSGQLGDGTVGQKTIPVALGALTSVIAVSGGGAHTLFLRSDGTLWATGLNSNSQLGDGTTTQSNVPIMVSTLTGVTAIDAGNTHSLALTSDGLVWAFGRNANGQLGDGTTTTQPFPVQTVNVNPCGRFEKRDQPAVPLAEVSLVETYPNPADQELTIDLPAGAVTTVTPILMYDAFGHHVKQDQFNPGEASKNINVSTLASGVYMLRVNTSHGVVNKRVLIVH